MNKELLTTIKLLALDDPEHFDMETFADHCGTTCCIAGFAVKIATPERFSELQRMSPAHGADESEWMAERARWEGAGATALGLTRTEALRLFYYDNWPQEFYDRYDEARHPEVGAAYLVAAAVAHRIDHFIATEGRE